jgi:replicative DNA helicase
MLMQQAELTDNLAEYQLIGWVLTDNSFLANVFYLGKEAFDYCLHAEIWQAMKALNRQGKEITPFTLRPLLRADEEGFLPMMQYLAQSISSSLLLPNPLGAAKYLHELHQKRKLTQACNSFNSADSLQGNMARISRAMQDIAADSGDNDFEDNLEVADRILKDMANTKLPYATGIRRLDEAMDGGLYDCKSYGFAARKKVGKTALAATISANLNMAGVKHLFICGEMSPKEIHQRVLARHADIFPSAFRNEYGKSNDCADKVFSAIQNTPRNTLYKNAPGLTFEALRQVCTLAVEKHAVRGVILDYWQLVGGKAKNQSTAEHLDEVAQWIADFGRTYQVWTITMAQLNQEDNTRGGEGIRLAFDQLYQLHRENLTQPYSWLEMMETRYTQWRNVGSKEDPRLYMNEKGPFFEERA